MDSKSSNRTLIAKFGTEIAKLHERRVKAIKRELEKIHAPQSEYDHALAAYYNAMDHDQQIIALVQDSIEGTLHDLFFIFEEYQEFKLMLANETGGMIDLAQAEDELRAFPIEWIENKSSEGYEGYNILAFLTEKLNFNETRQERRARILASKDKK